MKDAATLLALAERVATGSGCDNALDIEVELALFEPDDEWAAIRVNDAGTKTICTSPSGKERTFWARDYTISAASRSNTAAALRAHAAIAGEG